MYLDTDIIYGLIKPEDQHSDFAKKIFEMKEKKYSSVALIIELELVIKKEVGETISRRIFDLLKGLPQEITIIEINKKTMELSLQLRRENNLGIFDSIHAASALLKDKRIASTDDAYDRVKGLTRIK